MAKFLVRAANGKIHGPFDSEGMAQHVKATLDHIDAARGVMGALGITNEMANAAERSVATGPTWDDGILREVGGEHTHTFTPPARDWRGSWRNADVNGYTSESAGHRHILDEGRCLAGDTDHTHRLNCVDGLTIGTETHHKTEELPPEKRKPLPASGATARDVMQASLRESGRTGAATRRRGA